MKKMIMLLILMVILAGCTSAAKNPLDDLSPTVEEYKSGSGDILGEYAYVTISKASAKHITEEQFVEFCESTYEIKHSDYFVIDFGDGTGIRIDQGNIETMNYGEIDVDRDRSMRKVLGRITRSDGNYTYK